MAVPLPIRYTNGEDFGDSSLCRRHGEVAGRRPDGGALARQTSKATVRKARVLRREMSLPEVMLWQILRTKPCGVKFRRQHPVGRFVADFYCPAAKLIIEIDGIAHDMGDRPERDEARDAMLRERGYGVVRALAKDVLRDVEEVAQSIVALCHGPSTIGFADGPPPHSLRERGGWS